MKFFAGIPLDKAALKKFGLTMGAVTLLIVALALHKHGLALWPWLALPLLLAGLGLGAPRLLLPVYLPWMGFAKILGWIMTRVLLGLLFVLVISPIAIFAKLFGKRFLEMRPDAKAESYWEKRSPGPPSPESYGRQF
jgi:Saxitoxin biosynthesis operon protein SxtJ